MKNTYLTLIACLLIFSVRAQNLGIGTPQPDEKVHIRGADKQILKIQSDNNVKTGLEFVNGAGSFGADNFLDWRIQNEAGKLDFLFGFNNQAPANFFTLDPGSKEISASGAFIRLFQPLGSPVGSELHLGAPGGGLGLTYFLGDGTAGGQKTRFNTYILRGEKKFVIDGTNTSGVSFTAIAVDELGNVAIGKRTASSRLDVAGSAKVAGNLDITGTTSLGKGIEVKMPLSSEATNDGITLNAANRKWRMTVGGDQSAGSPFFHLLYKNHNDPVYTPYMTINHANGNMGVGTTNPSSKIHVRGSAGTNKHVALIENTNANGSGLKIKIDGHHGMFNPAEGKFIDKAVLPVSPTIDATVGSLRDLIDDGKFNFSTTGDLKDVSERSLNEIELLTEIQLNGLMRPALCDGLKLIVKSIIPELDLESELPSEIKDFPTLPELGEIVNIDLPDFPSDNLAENVATFDPLSLAIGVIFENAINIPHPANLPVLRIPKSKFNIFNDSIDESNGIFDEIGDDLNKMRKSVSSLESELGELDLTKVITSITGCENAPSFVETYNFDLQLADKLEKTATSLDHNNHFITFVDQANRELGAIKAQHPADYLLDQISTNNLLELASIIPGLVSFDGGAVSSVIDLYGYVYNWTEEYNSVGVTYESTFGDYAEWLPREAPDEVISYGDIVGIKSGVISKDLADAEQVMVVSKAPIIMGNAPNPDSIAYGNNVAFIGQVPVKVMGAVSSGDYIVADLNREGYAKAIAPGKMTAEDFKYAVGRSWDTKPNTGFKFVNTLVGMHTNGWVAPVQQMQRQVKQLEQQQTRQNGILSQLAERIENLESNTNE